MKASVTKAKIARRVGRTAPRVASSARTLEPPSYGIDFVDSPAEPTSSGSTAIQAMLIVGAPDDPYEREADRVADRISQRVPEPVLQAKGATSCSCGGMSTPCREERRLQRKAPESAEPHPSSVPNDFLASLDSGRALHSRHRIPFETALGVDLGPVRIHTGPTAVASARSIHARAFTAGRDVVFGDGEFRPDAPDGRRLLAHELTHVVQQGAVHPRSSAASSSLAGPPSATPAAPSLQRFVECGEATDCPARADGESTLTDTLAIMPLPTPDLGLLIEGFAVGSDNVSSLASTPEFVNLQSSLETEPHLFELLGFSDCRGSESLNLDLRRRRAESLFNALSPGAQARITGSVGAPLPDCIATNSTPAGRRQNRSVALRLVSTTPVSEGEETASSCPAINPGGTSDLGEYIGYLRCAELRTRFTPRRMLALMRQLYYGKPWSITATTNRWDNVIPCSPAIGHPEPILGTDLYSALRNSARGGRLVGGVDIGHVFTGLEAMTCPQPSVAFLQGLVSVAVPNEQFATFTGDLGASAASFVACNEIGQSAASEESCGFHPAPENLRFYYDEHAPSGDLEGDIDAFSIRAQELGIQCRGSFGTALPLSSPVSQLFEQYYSTQGQASSSARQNRYECLLAGLGATLRNGRIANRPVVLRALVPRVYAFALAFYHSIRFVLILPGPGASIRMRIASSTVSDWFLSYLESDGRSRP